MADSRYANLTNEEYWIARNEERTDKFWRKEANVEKYLAQQYRLALDDIRQQVIDLYSKYAVENNLDYQTAMKDLNPVEIEDYKAKLDRMLPQIKETNNPFLISEFEKLQTARTITRLQALMNQINARLLPLVNDEQITMDEFLSGTYESNYYQALYEIQVGTGVAVSFVLLDEQAIRTAITMPWANGEMFSDRIWSNKEMLVKELRQTITQGLIQGLGSKKMSKNLQEKMDTSFYNAQRIVRTETANIMESSSTETYKNSGIVHQYRIVATKDLRTSSICRKMDGKVFDLKELAVGVNAPPFHPFCRTTKIVVFDDMDLSEYQQRVRDKEGKNILVPASMTYDEWYQKFITEGVPQ